MPYKDLDVREAYNKAYRERNREKARLNTAAWRRKNPNYAIGYYSKYVAKNPEYYKMRNLKRYGLTSQQYDDLFWKQGGRCALCQTNSHNGKGWHIDHCHTTGKVRGILCNNCNVGLGHFKERIELLKTAIEYLEKHK